MRFIAPARDAVDPRVFAELPLSQWQDFDALLRGEAWPDVADLQALAERAGQAFRFVEQTPRLLADGRHYEQRIAECGAIATRARNWHDLLNALVWLRFAPLKAALNARQVAQIGVAGPGQRTRAQCALTLFDETGVIVRLRDARLLAMWDAHDWHGLFWNERGAWLDGRIGVVVFGHALLEHALNAGQLLVGKALVLLDAAPSVATERDRDGVVATIAAAIRAGELCNDPQDLRPLPLSGIPGWHAGNASEAFYREAACFRPLRAGRTYPAPYTPRAATDQTSASAS
jgi:hypothetical protein